MNHIINSLQMSDQTKQIISLSILFASSLFVWFWGAPNKSAHKKQIATLVIFFVTSMLVWYVGPQLAVGNNMPLASSENRLITIVLFFLACIAKLFFLIKRAAAAATPPKPKNPLIIRNMLIVESRLRGAIRFLKNTSINKNGRNVRLHRLPWYLLIGASNAGKSTLLANANVNFILDKQFKQKNIKSLPHSETCDWRATRDLVLVDVPGTYVCGGEQNTSMANHLWHSFLDLIVKLRGEQGLSGIIMTVSIAELMDKQKRIELAAHLKKRITELRERFGIALPFYVALTKCDLLPGFLDFFSDYTSDELSQAWGITLPFLAENESLAEAFSHRFNALIKRLNQQLILHMHQERSLYARIYIKDFPLQVERIKDACADLLKLLANVQDPFYLKGVYLTSAMQDTSEKQTSNYPQLVLADEFQQALQIMRNPVMPTHAYFIKQFILQGLTSNEQAVNTGINWQHMFTG